MAELIEKVIVSNMGVNCYLVYDSQTRECLVIDPGDDYSKIKAVIDRLKLIPKAIVNTHGHIDHIGADDEFDLPVYIHKNDAEFLTKPELNLSKYFSTPFISKSKKQLVEEGDKITVDSLVLDVIHTPGHTPGSMCLKMGNVLFSGDTLFFQGIGRTDFNYGSEEQICDSIKNKIFSLSEDIVVYPGHGPSTTIKNERKSNPFFE